MQNKFTNAYNKRNGDGMENIPVMPVANKPRYFVMGKRCVTLVWSKSLSCMLS